MDIFISFSAEGREKYAIKFLEVFNSLGIKCWYDQHQLLLGDLLKTAIVNNGINRIKYGILIINKAYLNRIWPCKEAELLFDRALNEENFILFPLLDNVTKEEVKNSSISYILNIKYQFIGKELDLYYIAYQILNRILSDNAKRLAINSIDKIIEHSSTLPRISSINIHNALNCLQNLSPVNYTLRAAVVIVILQILDTQLYCNIINKIAGDIYANKKISLDQYGMLCSILILSYSIYLG